jgi:hypothetical protein
MAYFHVDGREQNVYFGNDEEAGTPNEEERDHQRGIYLGKEEASDSSSEQGEEC